MFWENIMEKNKIKVMGIKEIEDKKEDWPGSSHWEQAPGYQ